MAKTRKRTTQKKVQAQPKIAVNIEEVQAQTLATMEWITAQSPRIDGVPVLQCCMYDIVQMMNGAFVARNSK